MKILVLNDQKMGHLNQSLALAKLSGTDPMLWMCKKQS